MPLVSTRLRGSVRLRLAILGAAGLMLVGATGLIAAGVFNQNGPFTGCLSSKLGIIYNVAQGATPLATCIKGDSVVTFSNAQGQTGPAGPSGAPGKSRSPKEEAGLRHAAGVSHALQIRDGSDPT